MVALARKPTGTITANTVAVDSQAGNCTRHNTRQDLTAPERETMHESIQNLLDLHDINQQRQILKTERSRREDGIAEAQAKLDAINEQADAARGVADEYAALITQKQQDIEDADKQIEELRGKQGDAKTNKEYMAIINGIEEAKSTKTLAKEKLEEVQAIIDEAKAKADEIDAERQAIKQEVDATIAEIQGGSEVEVSEAELDKLYEAQAPKVDAAILEVYERLVKSKHPMPLMPIDANTRATPYGNLISHNQMEEIRMGKLMIDQTNNAILYIKE